MSFKYGAYIKHFYYLKKGEVSVKNEFKAGDLVFELTARGRVLLSKLSHMPLSDDCVSTDLASYTSQGINEQLKVSRLFHATPENRQALVTLYGEDAVPELPVRGSELTKKLLERQKYVMCWVSNHSDERAREWHHSAYIATASEDDGFTLADGGFALYAIPVDNNGNEITEIE